MGWIDLFTPPEWGVWSLARKLAYIVVLTVLMCGVVAFASWFSRL